MDATATTNQTFATSPSASHNPNPGAGDTTAESSFPLPLRRGESNISPASASTFPLTYHRDPQQVFHTPTPLPLRLLPEPLPHRSADTDVDDRRVVEDFWGERYLARGPDRPLPSSSTATHGGRCVGPAPPAPRENAWPPAPLTPLTPVTPVTPAPRFDSEAEDAGRDDGELTPTILRPSLPSSATPPSATSSDVGMDSDQVDDEEYDDGYDADSEFSPTIPSSPPSPLSSAPSSTGATRASSLSPASPWSIAFRKRHGLPTHRGSPNSFSHTTSPTSMTSSTETASTSPAPLPPHQLRRARAMHIHPLTTARVLVSPRRITTLSQRLFYTDPSPATQTVSTSPPSPPWPVPPFPPAPYEWYLDSPAHWYARRAASLTAYDLEYDAILEEGDGNGDWSPLFPRQVPPTPEPAVPPRDGRWE